MPAPPRPKGQASSGLSMMDGCMVMVVLGIGLLVPWGPARAEPVRFLTWNAQSFTNCADPGSTLAARLNSAALWLREFKPDVVLLQEVPDWQSAHRLATQLGPEYAVAVCSSLADAGQSVPRQPGGEMAIVSRLPAVLSWSGPWEHLPPQSVSGGFAFAVLQAPGNQWVSVHSVLFPSGPDAVEARAAAMRQLLGQVALTMDWKTNRPTSYLLGGTLQALPETASVPAEPALDLARQADWKSAYAISAAPPPPTLRARGPVGGRTTDYLLTSQGIFLSPPTVHWGIASDHACVVADCDRPAASKPDGLAAAPTAGELAPAKPLPPIPSENSQAGTESPSAPVTPQFPTEGQDEGRLFGVALKWWVAGLAVFTLLLCLLILRRTDRRRLAPVALVPLSGQPGAVQFQVGAGLPPSWRRQVRPHLLAWLKERFIGGLLLQRQQMIDLQHHASDRADELGRRVEQIQEALTQKIREAEARVGQLERELAQAKAENRELIQVNLALAQRELEEARRKVQWSVSPG